MQIEIHMVNKRDDQLSFQNLHCHNKTVDYCILLGVQCTGTEATEIPLHL